MRVKSKDATLCVLSKDATLKISYSVIGPQNFNLQTVTLRILNSSGEEIKTQNLPAVLGGGQTTEWDGRDNAGGIVSRGKYIATIEAEAQVGKAKGEWVVYPYTLGPVEIRDQNNPCNKAPGKLPEILIIATDRENKTYIQINGNISPDIRDFKEHVLWQISKKASIPLIDSPLVGDFSGGDHPVAVLVPDILGTAFDYELLVGVDLDNNGLLEAGKDDIKYAPTVIPIREQEYRESLANLTQAALFGEVATRKFAASLLLLFLGRTDLTLPFPPSRITEPYLLTPTLSLSHYAGEDFDNFQSCNAEIRQIVYDSNSEPAKLVANSSVIRGAMEGLFSSEEERSRVRQAYLDSPGFSSFEFETRFPSTVLDFKAFTLSDLGLALGSATTEFSKIIAHTFKEFDQICIRGMRLQGNVDDLYDFDYFSPDRVAAILQFGWNSRLGEAGRIFWNTVSIDQEISFNFCFQ